MRAELRQALIGLRSLWHLPLQHLRKRERKQAEQPGLFNVVRFLLGSLKITVVRRVQREVFAVQRTLRQDRDRVPHLVHGLGQLPQIRQAYSAIVACHRVSGIPRDQIAEFLHARLVVAGPLEGQTARAVTFALRHAVEMTDRFLDVFLSILQLVEVARRNGHACVAETKVRIGGDRFREAASRLLEAAVGQGIHRRSVVTHDVQRRRRKRVHGEELAGVGRVVAERLAHHVRELRRHTEHLLFVGSPVSCVADHVAGHGLGRFHCNDVTAALAVTRRGSPCHPGPGWATRRPAPA